MHCLSQAEQVVVCLRKQGEGTKEVTSMRNSVFFVFLLPKKRIKVVFLCVCVCVEPQTIQRKDRNISSLEAGLGFCSVLCYLTFCYH